MQVQQSCITFKTSHTLAAAVKAIRAIGVTVNEISVNSERLQLVANNTHEAHLVWLWLSENGYA